MVVEAGLDSTESALLNAICEDPFDNFPRLVYADWLQEHNQEQRAEFIRVQIELSKFPPIKKVYPFRISILPEKDKKWYLGCQHESVWLNGSAELELLISEADSRNLRCGDWLEIIGGESRLRFEYSCVYSLNVRLSATSGNICEVIAKTIDFNQREFIEKLLNKEKELLDEHHFDWLPKASMDLESLYSSMINKYSRGFVGKLQGITLGQWEKYGLDLANQVPLTEVWITDKVALLSSREGNSFAYTFRFFPFWQLEGDTNNLLPIWLSKYLNPNLSFSYRGTELIAVNYRTLEAARQDLSIACINWARDKAGFKLLSNTPLK